MLALLLLPFVLQMVAMAIDELHFHRARGLPRWERIGHPLDTLSVIACLAWTLFAPFGRATLAAYGAFAVASCLLVTKDEAVHARHCTAREHWLHAVLFLLHPMVLACAAIVWAASRRVAPLAIAAKPARAVLLCELAITAIAGLHQTLFWNLRSSRRRRAENVTS
jgi:hypothetical protein